MDKIYFVLNFPEWTRKLMPQRYSMGEAHPTKLHRGHRGSRVNQRSKIKKQKYKLKGNNILEKDKIDYDGWIYSWLRGDGVLRNFLDTD